MNLNQVTVPSRNVERAAAFYRALGLREIVRNLPSYTRFECPSGGSTFSIHLVPELPSGEGTIVYFECDDVDREVVRLQSAGIACEQPAIDQPWLWREAYFRDPDGNQICLYHAGNNRRFPPWRLASL